MKIEVELNDGTRSTQPLSGLNKGPTLRYSLATLLMWVLVVAAYFPTQSAFNHWQKDRLKSHYPEYLVNLELSRLQQDETFESASRKFPHFSRMESSSRTITTDLLSRAGMPIDDNTEVYMFEIHGANVMLTFRDGRLVNHDQLCANDPITVAQRQGHPYPGFWHRLGLMPYYVVFALGLITIYNYFNTRRSNSADNQSSPLV